MPPRRSVAGPFGADRRRRSQICDFLTYYVVFSYHLCKFRCVSGRSTSTRSPPPCPTSGNAEPIPFALNAMIDCLNKLWWQSWAKAGTRRNFFDQPRFLAERVYLADWFDLLETTLGRRGWWRCRPDADEQRGRLRDPAGADVGGVPPQAGSPTVVDGRCRTKQCGPWQAAKLAPKTPPTAVANAPRGHQTRPDLLLFDSASSPVGLLLELLAAGWPVVW